MLMHWFSREASKAETILYGFGCLMFQFVYNMFIEVFFTLAGLPIASPIYQRYMILLLTAPYWWLQLLGVVTLQEVLFRLPLAVLIQRGMKLGHVLLVATLFSMLCGLAYGNVTHVFIEGAAGFCYSLLFLKCGGLQGKWAQALVVTIAIHAVYDFISLLVFFVAHVLGG